MRYVITALLAGFVLVTLLSLKTPSPQSIGVAHTIVFFQAQADEFAASLVDLQTAIAAIRKDKPETVREARKALQHSRVQYKSIQFFLAYFFKSNAIFFNGQPKPEIEEPFMEWQTPTGLQVIESLLYETNPPSQKKELLKQMEALTSSAADLKALLYGFTADDKQVLESIRLELIRIYTLGITGFDAPFLKSGMTESLSSLKAIQTILAPYLEKQSPHADSVHYFLAHSLNFLQQHQQFDSFDRLGFLTKHGLPLQHYVNILIEELGLFLNTSPYLNYRAQNLFSADAINLQAFSVDSGVAADKLTALGKKLFFDKNLSGNKKISCATCHNPDKHFSDGEVKSFAFDGHSRVPRNAPTLLYAGFQHRQTWDSRVKTIEEQVKAVIENPVEMNGNYNMVLPYLNESREYRPLFKAAFSAEADSLFTAKRMATAIASYVRSLALFTSPFDSYMQGDSTALTAAQKRGFNLFMGKAACGTCHFAPLFNGLVPPLYNVTELEVLGTPKTDQRNKPVLDGDKGRYGFFKIEFYKSAFKTPTVRNVSATAPYMHNGAFRTLESVVDFYNRGGGAGWGLTVKNQTLSPLPLRLTATEVKDIVSFMHALKDSVSKE